MTAEEGQRYRQAATDALEQLDWCIGYLCGIRKVSISRQLAKNRAYIKRNLMQEPAEPLPSEVAGIESGGGRRRAGRAAA